MGRILPFVTNLEDQPPRRVGRVHLDASITFRGETYATLMDLPPECQGLRPDVHVHRQWRALYRHLDPARRER